MTTELAPKRKMVDIHMHLIPGIDDGAEDMEMALVMVLQARRQGISRIVVTPHSEAFHFSKEDGRARFQRLADVMRALCPEVKLYLGCEVYCEAPIMTEVLELLDSKFYPTMNGTNYVLMEFSQWVYPENTVPCITALTGAGYIPIVAHMERYQHLREHMELVAQLRELGAKVQVTSTSLQGETDESIKNWARQLVLARMVDFLGTDAHKTWFRAPNAEDALNWLYENVDRAYADAVTRENANRLLCI